MKYLAKHFLGSRATLEQRPPVIEDSILSIFQPLSNGDTRLEKLHSCSPPPSNYTWYLQWVAFQLSTLPESIKLLVDECSDLGTANLLESKRFRLIFSSVN
jgi:hypothetical protein